MRKNIETLDDIFDTIDLFESWLETTQKLEVSSVIEEEWSICLQTLISLFDNVTTNYNIQIENNLAQIDFQNPYRFIDQTKISFRESSENKNCVVKFELENESDQEMNKFFVRLEFTDCFANLGNNVNLIKTSVSRPKEWVI